MTDDKTLVIDRVFDASPELWMRETLPQLTGRSPVRGVFCTGKQTMFKQLLNAPEVTVIQSFGTPEYTKLAEFLNRVVA